MRTLPWRFDSGGSATPPVDYYNSRNIDSDDANASLEARLEALEDSISTLSDSLAAIRQDPFRDGEQPAIYYRTAAADPGQTFWAFGWNPQQDEPAQFRIDNYGEPSWGPQETEYNGFVFPEVGRYLLSGWCSMDGSGHTVNSARPIGLEIIGAGGGNDYVEQHLTLVWQSASDTTYGMINMVVDVTELPTGTGPYAITVGNPQGFQITSHGIAFSAGDIFDIYLMVIPIGHVPAGVD